MAGSRLRKVCSCRRNFLEQSGNWQFIVRRKPYPIVERRRQLAHGMGKDVAIWKAQEWALLSLERNTHLLRAPVTSTDAKNG
jgi:hypothetical protein